MGIVRLTSMIRAMKTRPASAGRSAAMARPKRSHWDEYFAFLSIGGMLRDLPAAGGASAQPAFGGPVAARRLSVDANGIGSGLFKGATCPEDRRLCPLPCDEHHADRQAFRLRAGDGERRMAGDVERAWVVVDA